MAKWRPVCAGTYPNRPPSPGRHRSTDVSVRGFNPKKKVGKWVGSRGRGGSSTISAMMRGETPKSHGRSYVPGLRPAASIPGLPAAARAGGKGKGGGNKSRSRRRNKNKNASAANNAQTATKNAAATTPASPAASAPAATSAPDAGKLAKKLNKKLRQIETLKERKQKGEKMSAQQITKINLESSIRKQLSDLKL